MTTVNFTAIWNCIEIFDSCKFNHIKCYSEPVVYCVGRQ